MNNSPRDPDDVDILLNRLPRRLTWGLAKGLLMLLAAAGLTYVAATVLQTKATQRPEIAAQPSADTPPSRR